MIVIKNKYFEDMIIFFSFCLRPYNDPFLSNVPIPSLIGTLRHHHVKTCIIHDESIM